MGSLGAASSGTGMFFKLLGTGKLRYRVKNAGTDVLNVASSGAMAANTVYRVAMTIDENAGVGCGSFYLDKSKEDFDCAYTSPAITAASQLLEIAAQGNGVSKAPNGTEIYAVRFYNRKLSASELDPPPPTISNTMPNRQDLQLLRRQ